MKIREVEITDERPLVVRVAGKSASANYNPPKTLGRPRGKTKEVKQVMAMDACIKNVLSGFQDELYSCGTPMFAGYGVLSSVSQEALIRAGVETIADEMTRKFVKIRYDVDDGKDDHEKEISDIETQFAKYKVKERFNEATQKDGYFGGCLVYIDVGELDDDEKEEPLILDKKTFKKGMLKGFKVIEPVNVYPGNYNTTDPTNEYYFNPEYWYILGKKYHASRFLYFAGNSVPVLLKPAYNFFGIARSQLALDYVAHFVENRESAQELLNKFSLTCWKTDMSQVLAGESCNDLVRRVKMFNKMKSNSRTLVVDKEQEDVVQINTPLGGVREIVDMSLSLLTAVWRIPKIKYIGEGEGGLNASSKEQMRSFYDFIGSQKEKMFTQPMEKVLKIIQLNMGKDINESIGFEFPSLVEMDDSEIAQLNKMKADTAVQLINAGVVSQEEVRQNLSMDKQSGFSMIDVDDLPEQQDSQEENEEETLETEDSILVEDLVNDSFEGHAGRIGQVGGSIQRGFLDKNIPVVDLTKEFKETNPTLHEVEKFVDKLVEKASVFATYSPDWFIKMPNGSYRKGHIVHQNGWENMPQKEKEMHNKYVMLLEKIINNSVHVGEKENKSFWNIKKKNVLKYHYFESKIKVGEKTYNVFLDTEQFKNDSEEFPRTVSLYNIKGTDPKHLG